MQWIAESRFVPPFGTFSKGDDLSHLPQTVLDDLAAQGLVALPVPQAQAVSVKPKAPVKE